MAEYDRLVILAAGKSTRLGGENKLLVEADGIPVHEWHHRASESLTTDVVVHLSDWSPVNHAVERWVSRVMFHQEYDGPGGALRHYVNETWHEGGLVVLFADTLLKEIPKHRGSWVGLAPGPWRVWDYPSGNFWVRGEPRVEVCCGVYRFDSMHKLRKTFRNLPLLDSLDMIDVLNMYETIEPMKRVPVEGWQDAGDRSALSRVRWPWSK